jgi:chromate transporter
MRQENITERVPLLGLLWVFLKVGATGFGGAMPMIAMIQGEVVQKHHWVTPQEFSDAVTLGQITPGPVAVDTIVHLGYKLHGWTGAVLSVFVFVLPSFLLMLALTMLYLQYGQLPQVTGAFKGIGAAVVAIILAASYRMGRSAIRDVWSGLIVVAAGVALLVFSVNIVLIIVVAGVIGLWAYRNQPVGQPVGARPQGPDATGKGGQ